MTAKKRKAKRPPLTNRQIHRWFRTHYEAWSGSPYDDAPAFSRMVRAVDLFAEKVERLRWAMHHPAAPGAAAVIQKGDMAWADDLFPSNEGSLVDCYGDAIAWGLNGAPEEELDRMRAAEAERAADRRAECEKKETPEALERYGALHTEHAVKDLIEAVRADGHWLDSSLKVAPRSVGQRREIIARLVRELLGEDWRAPAAGQAPAQAVSGEAVSA